MSKVRKAVVLAGGKGKRMWPITRPKPLIPYAGNSMLGHAVKRIRAVGIEDIFVIGNGDKGIAEEAKKLGARHLVQRKKGSGGALLCAGKEIDERFLVIAVDTYCKIKDIEMVAGIKEGNVVSVKEAQAKGRYGKVVMRNNKVVKIEEKRSGGKFVNTSLYVFEPDVFDALEKAPEHENGEIYLTDVVEGAQVYMMKGEWIDIGYPWDLLKANELELADIKSRIRGEIKGAKIKGKVVVEEGALVEDSFIYGNAYIGKDCVVGPKSMLNGFVCLMEGVEIGFGTIVKNSIVMEGTKAKHLSYIGDSVVGREVNFGAGSLISNLRFDKKEIRCHSNGKLVGTGRVKFGAVVGDKVQIGVNANLMPGTLVKEGTCIMPGSVVKGKVEQTT